MKLKAVVKDLSEVDEKYHDLYIERNGEYQLDRIEGMATEADVQRVQKALDSERKDRREIEEKYRPFKNMDPQEVQEKLDKFDEYKELADNNGGDVEERAQKLADARIKSALGPVERERDELKTQVQQKDEVLEGFTKKDRKRTIHDEVRSAASELNVLPSALDDALMLAEHQFDISEDNKVITKEDAGVTPGIDPKTWLSEMQEKRPHWWPVSEGGGAGGGSGGNATDNPWSKKNWNMTEQSKKYKENPQQAERMAKSAGTTIGGPKPE